MKEVTEINSYNQVPQKGISWRAIFAGTLTVISVMLVLNLIGLAVGLGSINPTEESNPLSGIGTGSLIWWIVSCLISLFAGGYVAGRVGVSFSSKSGIIQGIMTWALYTILSAWLLTSVVGSIISGVGNVVGGVLSQTGQVVQNQLGPVIQEQTKELDISLEDAKQRVYSLLEDTQKESLDPDRLESNAREVSSTAQSEAQDAARNPGSANAQIEQIFSEAKNQFENSYEELDKQALVNVIVERTDMSESEARNTVDSYLAEYENMLQQAEEFLANAEEQANETAGNVADAIADAALYLAIALILGIITAALGGLTGAKNLRNDYRKNNYFREDRVETGYRGENRRRTDGFNDEVH